MCIRLQLVLEQFADDHWPALSASSSSSPSPLAALMTGRLLSYIFFILPLTPHTTAPASMTVVDLPEDTETVEATTVATALPATTTAPVDLAPVEEDTVLSSSAFPRDAAGRYASISRLVWSGSGFAGHVCQPDESADRVR